MGEGAFSVARVGTSPGHGVYIEENDGWHVATCICGWEGPPCPGVDDAADSYGDHRAMAAVAAAQSREGDRG